MTNFIPDDKSLKSIVLPIGMDFREDSMAKLKRLGLLKAAVELAKPEHLSDNRGDE